MAGSVPGAGSQQPRTSFELIPTTKKLGVPSGATQRITYNDLEGQGKPSPVRKIVISLPRGTKIDTSVPARCKASDEQLMADGDAACPPRSRIGAGKVTAVTGFGPPADPVKLDVTVFNVANGLILLAKPEGSDQTAAVTRGTITGGRTITTEVEPVAGGPPDGQTSLKTVELTTNRIVRRRGGKRVAYSTTPKRCPANGRLITRAVFTYADGVVDRQRSAVACR